MGVILDTVALTLNTRWSQEFLYKQTHEYKELCFLTTLSQFLKVDAAALKKIEALYRHKLTKEINNSGQAFQKEDKIIDLNQFKENKEPEIIFKKNITDYLDSLYYEKHFLIFGDILKNKSNLVLADFFNNDEIKKLIETVHDQQV